MHSAQGDVLLVVAVIRDVVVPRRDGEGPAAHVESVTKGYELN